MAYPFTRTGYNIYDLMSLLQKGVRRGRFNEAGFAAKHLKNEYRSMMWNRILVISAEDCFGIITKEIVKLHNQDVVSRDDEAISKAIALMCASLKSRDACYYSCCFVLVTRKPREIEVTEEECERVKRIAGNPTEYSMAGFRQERLVFDDEEGYEEKVIDGARLQKAFRHRDMDMSGYYVDKYRVEDREFLWKVLIDNVEGEAKDEVIGLYEADKIVNKNKGKKDKNEIFMAKACVMEMYAFDYDSLWSSDIVASGEIDWCKWQVKNINDCEIDKIPAYTYDCHTLKGKQMGKTDWDMTVDEQAALFPLADDYFSEASWIYIYEDDYQKGIETDASMAPIREFAKTHEANPVKHIPYEGEEDEEGNKDEGK